MVILDMGPSPMTLACLDFEFSIDLWLDFRLFLFLECFLVEPFFRSGFVCATAPPFDRLRDLFPGI